MKLDRECIRDLMIAIEDLEYGYEITKSDFSEDERLKKYEFYTGVYAASKLIEAGFVNGTIEHADDDVYHVSLESLTWEGHQFLDNIRDEGIWKSTKKVASKFSSVSVTALSSIASTIVSKVIANELNL